MPKLFHADATSCSFDGRSYGRAEDGSFDVPAGAVAALVESHGFAMSAEAAAKRAERAEKPAPVEVAKSANEMAAAHVAALAEVEAKHAVKVKELQDQIDELTRPKKK